MFPPATDLIAAGLGGQVNEEFLAQLDGVGAVRLPAWRAFLRPRRPEPLAAEMVKWQVQPRRAAPARLADRPVGVESQPQPGRLPQLWATNLTRLRHVDQAQQQQWFVRREARLARTFGLLDVWIEPGVGEGHDFLLRRGL